MEVFLARSRRRQKSGYADIHGVFDPVSPVLLSFRGILPKPVFTQIVPGPGCRQGILRSDPLLFCFRRDHALYISGTTRDLGPTLPHTKYPS